MTHYHPLTLQYAMKQKQNLEQHLEGEGSSYGPKGVTSLSDTHIPANIGREAEAHSLCCKCRGSSSDCGGHCWINSSECGVVSRVLQGVGADLVTGGNRCW